ncbi:MAG: DUF5050 domain-containing protein [Proteobacteria bacterium]|nr:DUF5050 domain-containing protein [Pseudomonadota bacterium]
MLSVATDAAVPNGSLPDARSTDPDASLPDASVAPSFLYWVNQGESVSRGHFDGSDPNELIKPVPNGFRIAVDPNTRTIFYDHSSGNIARADFDGSNPSDVVTNAATVFGIAIDASNRKLYWTEFAANRIMRADLDGSNVEVVIDSGFDSPSGLALDTANSTLYFITYNSTALYRVNLDGSGLATIVPNVGGQGVDVAVHPSAQKVFYTARDDVIWVAGLDGSNPQTFISGQTIAQALAIDVAGGKLYWAALGKIRRADLTDGSNIEDLVTTNGVSWGVSLMPAQ